MWCAWGGHTIPAGHPASEAWAPVPGNRWVVAAGAVAAAEVVAAGFVAHLQVERASIRLDRIVPRWSWRPKPQSFSQTSRAWTFVWTVFLLAQNVCRPSLRDFSAWCEAPSTGVPNRACFLASGCCPLQKILSLCALTVVAQSHCGAGIYNPFPPYQNEIFS